ncbi:MAG: hypothetical protein M1829_006253 [Trizodia sp. TS-e1964]|nr:MAG: hypothetical protein M1829_006253 [Trizodia sp. TS-e1964]
MIDHVLGRPSIQFRKIQVFAVVSFWSLYLLRGDKHGPPVLRSISSRLSPRLTPWQSLVITLLWLYICRNFGKLVGLECPEPLSNLYSRAYFRATWVTTALDAGFWSAMRIRRKWARDLASLVFSIYYLIAAEQADEKVRKVRGMLTVEHLRVSWNKSTTPYISFFTKIMRPRLMRYPPRAIRIPRPSESSYREPVAAWLYFDGPLSELKNHNKVILDIPGGGYVAMNPRNHDDKLLTWAGRTGLPVLSLDYRKAPELPYPYALNECYDVYQALVASCGRCIGLSGETRPFIVVTGDSAGANLAVGMTLMILQSADTNFRRWRGEESIPSPDGLVLIYPSLDMNIGNWMTDEQMSLIRDKRTRNTNKSVLRRKSEDYSKLTPGTPHVSEDEEDASPPQTDGELGKITNGVLSLEPGKLTSTAQANVSVATQSANLASSKPQPLKTRLAMSSMISYFNDRILTPEMMRAMIILYVGPHNRPDFSTDFLLSPLLAPESLLARFPKTYFLTGERDPLVDDTVIFAGRIRQAKAAVWQERHELGLAKGHFDEGEWVEVQLIPGISHGFLQFVSVFPEGWRHIYRCARWCEELFARAEHGGEDADDYFSGNETARRLMRKQKGESSGEEDRPLEMSARTNRGARPRSGTEHPVQRDSDGKGSSRTRVARQKSTVSLANEHDLLGRRMKGVAGGLMGMGIEDGLKTPGE